MGVKTSTRISSISARAAVIAAYRQHRGDLDLVVRTTRKRRRYVDKWVAEYKSRKTIDDRARSGRRRVLSKEQEEALAAAVLAQQSVSAALAKLQAEGTISRQCSLSTAQRAVRHLLDLQTPTVQPVLTSSTKDKLSKRNHSICRLAAVDSSYFTMHGNHPRQRKWVPTGTKPVKPRPLKSQQLHVYGAITQFGSTKLVFATGTTGLQKQYFKVSSKGQKQWCAGVCAQEFQDIMSKHLVPQATAILTAAGHSPPVFLIDGAPCHTARDTKAFLTREGITIITGWPPNSPDLNPIENVWAWMKRRVYAQHYNSLAELRKAVLTAWEAVPASMLKNLMKSFNTRKKLCIERAGGHTGY